MVFCGWFLYILRAQICWINVAKQGRPIGGKCFMPSPKPRPHAKETQVIDLLCFCESMVNARPKAIPTNAPECQSSAVMLDTPSQNKVENSSGQEVKYCIFMCRSEPYKHPQQTFNIANKAQPRWSCAPCGQAESAIRYAARNAGKNKELSAIRRSDLPLYRQHVVKSRVNLFFWRARGRK